MRSPLPKSRGAFHRFLGSLVTKSWRRPRPFLEQPLPTKSREASTKGRGPDRGRPSGPFDDGCSPLAGPFCSMNGETTESSPKGPGHDHRQPAGLPRRRRYAPRGVAVCRARRNQRATGRDATPSRIRRGEGSASTRAGAGQGPPKTTSAALCSGPGQACSAIASERARVARTFFVAKCSATKERNGTVPASMIAMNHLIDHPTRRPRS